MLGFSRGCASGLVVKLIGGLCIFKLIGLTDLIGGDYCESKC